MSEPKAKHVVDVYDEYSANPNNESQVYLKSEADKAIAELEADKLALQQRLNVMSGELFSLSQSHNIKINECGCLKREISELKEKLAAAQLAQRLNEPEALYSNLDTMSRLSHEKDVVARRERKTQRALWLARLGIAKQRIAWYKLWNASISTMNPEDGARQDFDRWEKFEAHCRAKVKEYE